MRLWDMYVCACAEKERERERERERESSVREALSDVCLVRFLKS